MTKSEIIKKIKEKIQHNKSLAESKAEQNRKIALSNPKFKVLETNIATLNIQIAKYETSNTNASEEKKLLDVFLKEQSSLLEKLGLSLEDLSPKYFCNKCKDSGIYNDDYCDCFKSYLNDEYKQLNNASQNPTQTFENSNSSLLSEETKKAYILMEEWCDKFENSKVKNVVLHGGTGVGKTYLVNAISNRLLKRNILIQNLTAFNLNNQMLKYHTTFEENRAIILDSILNCDLLIIDDLGTESVLKNVTKEYLYLIINERLYNNKSTIITTNLGLQEIIDRYGERVFSRLMNKSNSILLNITGKDIRLKK